MRRQRIDLVNVQETKLQPHVMTPKMQRYSALNREEHRGAIKGGGLITYVWESLIHTSTGAGSKHSTEWIFLECRLNRRAWIHVTSVYIPPTSHCLEGHWRIGADGRCENN